MFRKKLFGAHIEPACEYCQNGTPTADARMILCERYGVVAPYSSCKKYQYDPLRRVPKASAPLPEYRAEDFEL